MLLKFSKMHGLGNDFMVIDAISQQVELSAGQIRRLAHRNFGIGFDQLLLVERAETAQADFRYRIFNADGGEVEQCGNGARCFVRFVRDNGLTDRNEIAVETRAGLIRPQIEADGSVSVDMGRPRLQPGEIPFLANRQALDYPLLVAGQAYRVGAVSMGNPHAVLRVDELEGAPVESLGPLIQGHERFPNGTNVGFMQVVERDHIRLRVFERGAGETLACGTGACAAVCLGRLWSLLDEEVMVDLPGGRLEIRWDGASGPVWMRGPAETVYVGEVTV